MGELSLHKNYTFKRELSLYDRAIPLRESYTLKRQLSFKRALHLQGRAVPLRELYLDTALFDSLHYLFHLSEELLLGS